MQYPGFSFPYGGGNNSDQQRRDLLKRLIAGTGNNLTLGGSAMDAPARLPGLSFNPVMSAYLGHLAQGFPGSQQSPFYGWGGNSVWHAVPPAVNVGSNPQANAGIITGATPASQGSAGGAAGGTPSAAPYQAPVSPAAAASTATRHLFGHPAGVQAVIQNLARNIQAPPAVKSGGGMFY